MTRTLVLFSLVALALACQSTQPFEPAVIDDGYLVTGVGVIDAQMEYPIQPEQTYPQVRAHAFAAAWQDAQDQMLYAISHCPVADNITLGDMMAQHRSVQLLAEDMVRDLPTDQTLWYWDEGVVEVDLAVSSAQLNDFIMDLPANYLERTVPAPEPVVVEQIDLPPTSAPAVSLETANDVEWGDLLAIPATPEQG